MDKQTEEMFNAIKEMRETKDLDKIQDLFLHIISMYGLKTNETAALLFAVMRNTLVTPQNMVALERMNIDPTKLGVEGILTVQRALVHDYNKESD